MFTEKFAPFAVQTSTVTRTFFGWSRGRHVGSDIATQWGFPHWSGEGASPVASLSQPRRRKTSAGYSYLRWGCLRKRIVLWADGSTSKRGATHLAPRNPGPSVRLLWSDVCAEGSPGLASRGRYGEMVAESPVVQRLEFQRSQLLYSFRTGWLLQKHFLKVLNFFGRWGSFSRTESRCDHSRWRDQNVSCPKFPHLSFAIFVRNSTLRTFSSRWPIPHGPEFSLWRGRQIKARRGNLGSISQILCRTATSISRILKPGSRLTARFCAQQNTQRFCL